MTIGPSQITANEREMSYLKDTLSSFKRLGIDYAIFEPNRIRATDQSNSLFVLHTTDVTQLSFGSIGINRLDAFLDRLALASAKSNFSCEVTVEKARDSKTFDFARTVLMKAKGLKVEFRCANPLTIKSPTKYGDTIGMEFDPPDELVQFLKQSKSAMSADLCHFTGDGSGVRFEVLDSNGDKLSYQIADVVKSTATGQAITKPFSFQYSIKTLITVLTLCSGNIQLTEHAGFLKVRVNQLDTFVVPKHI